MSQANTFNLVEWFRQMGLKNPDPSLSQAVQPVVLVGDYQDLTPLHQPPTWFGGGTIAMVPVQWSIVQITPRAPGGSVVKVFSAGSFRAGLAAPTAGLAVAPDRGPLSFEASSVLVESGTDAVDPLGATYPIFQTGLGGYVMDALAGGGMFIRPAATLVFTAATIATAVNWAMIVQDIPALETRPT